MKKRLLRHQQAAKKRFWTTFSAKRYCRSAVWALTLGLIGLTAPAQATLLDGLVAYWNFSGDATDRSGNANDGTLNGNASLGVDRFGNAFSALSLPTTSPGYVDVSASDQLQFGIGDTFTINAWVNYSSLVDNPRVLSYGPDGHGYEIRVDGGPWGTTPKQVVFTFGNSGIGSTTLLDPSEWYMLTLISSPSGKEIWINGDLDASNTSVPTSVDYNSGFNIGRKATPSFDGWRGLLDDIAIYDRRLTSNEIEALYNLSSGNLGTPSPVEVPETGFLPALGLGMLSLVLGLDIFRRTRFHNG